MTKKITRIDGLNDALPEGASVSCIRKMLRLIRDPSSQLLLKKNLYYLLRRVFLGTFLLLMRVFVKKENQKSVFVILASKIGDFIIFSPSLRYIKEAYPGYSLTVITDKSVSVLATTFSEIDEFIPLDTSKFQFNLLYAINISWKLHKKGFAIALYPFYSRLFIGDELVHMSNAKERIGFMGDNSNLDDKNRRKDNAWFTKLFKPRPDFTKSLLEVERYRYFCQQLGVNVDNDFSPRIVVPSNDIADGIRILKENGWDGGKYVVVVPGGREPLRWPADKFAKVVEYFVQNGFEVVFAGNKEERDLYDAISGKISEGSLINLMGRTTLLQLGGVLQDAAMYFGSDTGTLHLTAAMGTPAVCLLGGGHFRRFFPYGNLKKNRIVYDKHMKCKYDSWACARTVLPGQPSPCIANITIKNAIVEIKNLLN
jgi:ADP-heptose:LPS heptosyltransferase